MGTISFSDLVPEFAPRICFAQFGAVPAPCASLVELVPPSACRAGLGLAPFFLPLLHFSYLCSFLFYLWSQGKTMHRESCGDDHMPVT